jgi:chromosome segregation ATPase
MVCEAIDGPVSRRSLYRSIIWNAMSNIETNFAELALKVHTLSTHFDQVREQVQSILVSISNLLLQQKNVPPILASHQQDINKSFVEIQKVKDSLLAARTEVTQITHAHSQSVSKMVGEKTASLDALQSMIASRLDKLEAKIDESHLNASEAIKKANHSEFLTENIRQKFETLRRKVS